eukprot:16018_1
MKNISILTAIIFVAEFGISMSAPTGTYSGQYIVGPAAVSFADAQAYCHSQGANLASIHSQADQDAVWTLCNSTTNACWLGLTHVTGTTFAWSDGTDTDFGFFSNDPSQPSNSQLPWTNGEPSYDGECVIHYGYVANSWNDIECTRTFYPMCNDPPTQDPSDSPSQQPTSSPSKQPTQQPSEPPTTSIPVTISSKYILVGTVMNWA